ncbi:hypothetical protein PoB_002752000 [Plakobranchus ocellatus]|uniref:Uncharacterized protein n=1 Tax=Plakobranchus ocellatus TaxID=259542 RepID=A0AAV3ZYT1_9GAST|nr:hypothetical protein PoB_002752000 [Plakobranchus ocellatus]
MTSACSSSCEKPEYPNWMWRYNRNKHLVKFEPWFTRVERWPPHYRNMGVNDHFRFHPIEETEADRPTWQPGLTYAKELIEGRECGFGNKALGLVPGPAPPMFVYPEVMPHVEGELLKINCIENLTEGASLSDHSRIPTQVPFWTTEPLNPRFVIVIV